MNNQIIAIYDLRIDKWLIISNVQISYLRW